MVIYGSEVKEGLAKPAGTGLQRPLNAAECLAAMAGNRYIPCHIQILIRSRRRVGPSGPALFYYPDGPKWPPSNPTDRF